jgi:hypothetical protein
MFAFSNSTRNTRIKAIVYAKAFGDRLILENKSHLEQNTMLISKDKTDPINRLIGSIVQFNSSHAIINTINEMNVFFICLLLNFRTNVY